MCLFPPHQSPFLPDCEWGAEELSISLFLSFLSLPLLSHAGAERLALFSGEQARMAAKEGGSKMLKVDAGREAGPSAN